MSKQLEEIKTVISMDSLSDETKMRAVREIVNPAKVEVFKPEVLEEPLLKPKRKYTKRKGKRKVGVNYPNAGKPLTQTEVDTVAREYFKNGNTSYKAIGKLIGRSASSADNIVAKLRAGKLKASFKVKALSDAIAIGNLKVAKNYSKMG